MSYLVVSGASMDNFLQEKREAMIMTAEAMVKTYFLITEQREVCGNESVLVEYAFCSKRKGHIDKCEFEVNVAMVNLIKSVIGERPPLKKRDPNGKQ